RDPRRDRPAGPARDEREPLRPLVRPGLAPAVGAPPRAGCAMKIDAGLFATDVAGSDARAARLEAQGFAGAWSVEGPHDPFLPLAVAARATERLELGTAIAVAFARNPMTCAQVAWDLQALSKGRFILGLGTQIRPHIEKRFSQPWSRPAARMREFALA